MRIVKLPQLIDPHVHFRTPGLEYKENWITGSQAAIKGGITTVLDMPNTKPPLTTLELLNQKIETVAQDSLVNFGFHFAAATDNLDKIPRVVDRVASVKVFLNHSTGNLQITDDKILEKIFRGAPLIAVHAEGEMIEKAIWLTKRCGNQLYFCHTYSASAIDYIKKFKNKLPIFIEVTPHHLFLNKEDHLGPFYQMLPPLQTKKDNTALWQAISDGTVDTIGTDHAPHALEEKNSANPPFGVPGVETSLPLMLNAVNQGKLALERLIELMSVNPAKIFKIKTNPKTYTEVDLDLVKEVRNADLKTKCGWSPFAGWQLTGWPIKVVINDQIIMENEIINNNYKGKYLYV
ncbi:MAG: amidohydrolase family protein [Patescibacteria group bacterium]